MAITADLVRQNNVFHNKKLADLFKILIVKKKSQTCKVPEFSFFGT